MEVQQLGMAYKCHANPVKNNFFKKTEKKLKNIISTKTPGSKNGILSVQL